jgi:hypothetical protein
MTEEYPTASEFTIEQYKRYQMNALIYGNYFSISFNNKDYTILSPEDILQKIYDASKQMKEEFDLKFINKDNNAEITKRYFELNPDAKAKILELIK